jgi:hypothetical protein
MTVLFSFGGCQKMYYGEEGSLLDQNWGRSFQAAKENQILNPEAGKNLSPVVGLDGSAATANLNSYRKGFEEAAAEGSEYKGEQGTLTIGVGGLGTE